MSDVLPLPAGPEMTVSVPDSIFRLTPVRAGSDDAGHENDASLTSKATLDGPASAGSSFLLPETDRLLGDLERGFFALKETFSRLPSLLLSSLQIFDATEEEVERM